VRFADWMDNAKELTEKFSDKKYPTDFTLQDIGKLVVVYKIHGCLAPDIDAQNEGIIISDNDYVNYVSQMSTQEGAIPAHVHALMQGKPFLFLGYSLNDWNVRSIFETLTKKRNPTRDFSVMYSVRDFEKIFFDKNDVQILRTDLKNYIDGLLPHLPDEAKNRLTNHGK
jgi:SIR2-like domain